jgi:hypothetical protein
MAAIRMFVANKAALSAGDTVIKNRLELAHTVTVVDTTDAVSVAGVDLFVACSGSTSNYDARDYSGQNVPIVALRHTAWPMLGYSPTAGLATGSAVTHLRPWGAAHPIHDGHPTPGEADGDASFNVTVLSASAAAWRYPDAPPAGLAKHWRRETSSQPVIFTFEAGTALLSGKTAIRREAAWGFNDDTAMANLNAAGLSIFDEIIVWALDGAGSGTPLAVPSGWTFVKTSGVRTVTGSWSAVSGASTYEYQVERWTGSAWVTFATGSTASLTFSLTSANGVDWSTQYRARVRAVPA